MSPLPIQELVGAAVSLLLGSLAAGTEAAIVSLPEARMLALRDEMGPGRGAHLARYLADPTKVLSRLLAIRISGMIVAAVLATTALAVSRRPAWVVVAVAVSLVFVYGVLAEVFTTIGRARARVIAPAALAVSWPFEWLILPVAGPLAWLGHAINRRAALRHSSEPPPLTEREVEYVVEAAEESGALDPKRGQMMQNVLEFKDLTARDVMVPRTRMHAIEAMMPLDRALGVVIEEGHSRIPVFRGQIDNVIGVLHVKDLIGAVSTIGKGGRATIPPPSVRPASEPPPAGATVDAIARKPAFFVAESQSTLAVLRDMQARRTHMAIVVDEFGAVAGLVTMEDVLEELVGDIQDEHDADEATIVDQGTGRYLVSAGISVNDLGEHLGVDLPEAETYASLGGFLADRAGKVPGVGTVVVWNGLRFTVREGDARHATKVEIVREQPADSPATAHAAE
jgi:putative hemolysin